MVRRRHRALLILVALLASCRVAGRGDPPAAPSSAAAEVRAMRERSNAAIGARDLRGVIATMLPEMVVTAGSGSVLVGRDSTAAVFARTFADTTFLGYVRTPTRVDVSTAQPLAAEAGAWVGRWRQPGGVRELRGVYLAMWRRTADGWRLRSELFVTLSCTGSADCAPPR